MYQLVDSHNLYKQMFSSLHFLCTHFWQPVHFIELLPMPLPQTPHGHLTAFCITFCHSPLIISITLVLFIFTLMSLFSTLSFHSLCLVIRSSSVLAITTRIISISRYHDIAPQPCLATISWDRLCLCTHALMHARMHTSKHIHTHTQPFYDPVRFCQGTQVSRQPER